MPGSPPRPAAGRLPRGSLWGGPRRRPSDTPLRRPSGPAGQRRQRLPTAPPNGRGARPARRGGASRPPAGLPRSSRLIRQHRPKARVPPPGWGLRAAPRSAVPLRERRRGGQGGSWRPGRQGPARPGPARSGPGGWCCGGLWLVAPYGGASASDGSQAATPGSSDCVMCATKGRAGP